MENGPISRGSQSGVTMLRDLWRKVFTENVSFDFMEWTSKGVIDEGSDKRKMGW